MSKSYRPPAWLPATWPAHVPDTITPKDPGAPKLDMVEAIDPHRLIVAGLTDPQAAARIAWHQAKVNTLRTIATDLERMPPNIARIIAHHETVICAVLAQHHRQTRKKNR